MQVRSEDHEKLNYLRELKFKLRVSMCQLIRGNIRVGSDVDLFAVVSKKDCT
jgi:hypothetical protein